MVVVGVRGASEVRATQRVAAAFRGKHLPPCLARVHVRFLLFWVVSFKPGQRIGDCCAEAIEQAVHTGTGRLCSRRATSSLLRTKRACVSLQRRRRSTKKLAQAHFVFGIAAPLRRSEGGERSMRAFTVAAAASLLACTSVSAVRAGKVHTGIAHCH